MSFFSPPGSTTMSFFSPPDFSSFDQQFNKASNTINAAIVGYIIAAIISSIGFILAVILIYKCCMKHGPPALNINYSAPPNVSQKYTRIPKSEIRMATVENFLYNIANEKPIRFTAEQLQVFTNNYAEKLGSGGFGSVYKGELPNGVPVAVKLLSGNIDRRVVEEQFMAEVGTIGRTYHINLVRLFGFCFQEDVRALVYEFMENGSLDKYLFNNNHKLSYGMLHEIAIGTAKGIRYLHEECQQRIIHYDIKPGNILLDAQFNPKVADFGLAKLLNRERTHVSMTRARGTPGYAAPEMWMPSPVTYKCDVYSFGMLLFEIVGRRRNLDLTVNDSQEWFPKRVYDKFENGTLCDILSDCGIEEEHRETAERMSKVALWCVQYNPEARPPMSKVVKMLEGEIEIKPPMNPFQHLFNTGSVHSSDDATDSASSVASNEITTDSISSNTSNETRPIDATTIMRKYEIEIATR